MKEHTLINIIIKLLTKIDKILSWLLDKNDNLIIKLEKKWQRKTTHSA